MEPNTTRKRRRPEDDQTSSAICLDELNQDLLERVLSRLPSSSFFRCRSVCKRWSSVASSATFRIACSQLPAREPWFYMVGHEPHRAIVFDTSDWSWRSLRNMDFLGEFRNSAPIPVASSGGLICFRTSSGSFIVFNPLTGAHNQLPPTSASAGTEPIHAIAMNSISRDRFRLVVVSGDFLHLRVEIYDSSRGDWEEICVQKPRDDSEESDTSDDNTVYFLSKAGEVVAVATDMQRSPSKQYSSVISVEAGEEVIYFLSPSGEVVGCNLARKSFIELPRLLPAYSEYSIDVVECNGEMMAVILSDFLETSSMRIWKFCKTDRSWHQVASMPPSMSHQLYGKNADINCVGSRDSVVVCVSSNDYNGSFVCDLAGNGWSELPRCVLDGEAREFMSAFSFEPRIEACV